MVQPSAPRVSVPLESVPQISKPPVTNAIEDLEDLDDFDMNDNSSIQKAPVINLPSDNGKPISENNSTLRHF